MKKKKEKTIKKYRSASSGQFVTKAEADQKPDETVAETMRYGGNKTIHQTGELNVELHNGKVVAVWFRCLHLPFTQSEASENRAAEMERLYKTPPPAMVGVEVLKPKEK